jgi:hypothetical protein
MKVFAREIGTLKWLLYYALFSTFISFIRKKQIDVITKWNQKGLRKAFSNLAIILLQKKIIIIIVALILLIIIISVIVAYTLPSSEGKNG